VLIDSRTVPAHATLETDVCIVGAGAAGITLATELAGQPFRVLVVESGGLDYEADTQSLYRGHNVGLRYFPLETARLRYFGGTTNHWGGMCRPLAEADFARRDWIPHSGWPITRQTIAPFYTRALPFVRLREDEWTAASWAETDTPTLPLTATRVATAVHQRAWHPGQWMRFAEVHRDVILRARNITTCLHGNAVRIDSDATGRVVTAVHFASLAGQRFSVKARFFVVATGAIENARLLLLSNQRNPAGLGNDHDVVGRFFLEHPQLVAGVVQRSPSRFPLGFYRPHIVRGSLVSGAPELSEDLRRSEHLVNVWLDFRTARDERREAVARVRTSRRYLASSLRQGELPDDFGRHLGNVAADLSERAMGSGLAVATEADDAGDHVRLVAVVDPAPNPSSRVTLGTELDQLGQRRVSLDWRLSAVDKRSVRRLVEILGVELGRAGLGRVQSQLDGSDTTWPEDLVGSGHHIGTTRMSDDPKQGVVDRDCRVHGLANLFMGGSSVFPTAGSGTPTLLIIALAIRLSDHLKRLMK
jgi:choline dehydrogenase-like flavoprotein